MFFNQETLSALCELYQLLKEDDMMAGIWQKRAKYNETILALSYEQQGLFWHAQESLETVISQSLLLKYQIVSFQINDEFPRITKINCFRICLKNNSTVNVGASCHRPLFDVYICPGNDVQLIPCCPGHDS